jgi:hypothetical protein
MQVGVRTFQNLLLFYCCERLYNISGVVGAKGYSVGQEGHTKRCNFRVLVFSEVISDGLEMGSVEVRQE